MVVKTDASTDSALEGKITCVKYTLFCFNVTTWIVGGALFGLSLWLRVEPDLQNWFDKLTLQDVYKGIYILIAVSIAIMIISFVGCCGVLMEQTLPLVAFIVLQVVSFVLSLAGSAVFLDLSTYDSSLQPLIRQSMGFLVSNSQYEAHSAALRMIQENIGCCGVDGAQDYVVMRKPLPTECRDTVTGNAFFYGCVDEITWFLEDRSSWIAGIAMTLCMINVINTVLTIIFLQALKKEEEEVKH